MPRWPQKEVNAAEQEMQQPGSIELPTEGSVLVEEREPLIIADAVANPLEFNELAFMEEKVEVMVMDSTDANAENPVQVSCNGVNQFLWRNQPQVIRRKFVEILARAKTTSITTREVAAFDGERTIRIDRASALRYPFQVLRDENPRGGVWLRHILSQG